MAENNKFIYSTYRKKPRRNAFCKRIRKKISREQLQFGAADQPDAKNWINRQVGLPIPECWRTSRQIIEGLLSFSSKQKLWF